MLFLFALSDTLTETNSYLLNTLFVASMSVLGMGVLTYGDFWGDHGKVLALFSALLFLLIMKLAVVHRRRKKNPTSLEGGL